jgi:D-threo-aldose 1-dehydrogenase
MSRTPGSIDERSSRRAAFVDQLPPLGVGCGTLANSDGATAFAGMIEQAFASGVSYFDTAALYLGGESERRLGAALRRRPRTQFLVSTKIGRRQGVSAPAGDAGGTASVFDYSADEAFRSVEASLKNLNLDFIDLVMIHDLSRYIHKRSYEARLDEAMRGAYEALRSLRKDGAIGAIGVASMDWTSCMDLARLGDFDAVMPAGQYTLLDRACDPLLDHCLSHGAAVIAASPFNSGILATGAIDGAIYNMQPASPAVLGRVAGIEAACRRHGVPLAAAALQFPLRHKAVSTVVVGCRSAAEFLLNRELRALDIPGALWAELESMAEAGITA